MVGPVLISEDSFQNAWVSVSKYLCGNGWETHNLIVSIKDPDLFDDDLHNSYHTFAESTYLIKPKDVAYTIFPHKLYSYYGSASKLFNSYNRTRGLYERLRRKPHRGWGTYFKRMTHYQTPSGTENQLKNIIDAINSRDTVSRAAYTVIIQNPGGETIRPLGSPCLNYLAVQLDSSERKFGLLAVYRNHDFLGRAYGNYWGLCNLLQFMARETNFDLGHLTCVSSHAYIPNKKRLFKDFIESI